MLRTICFFRKDNSAFTMIELLVVIAVLGILASIAVPRMSGVTDRARLAVDQAAVRNLNSVTSVYRSSKHSDPFIDQANTNQSLLQILADNDYIPDNFEPQSENIEFAWLFEEERWSLFFEDNFYVVSIKDGLEFGESGGQSSHLFGPYTGSSKNIFIPSSIDGVDITDIQQDVFSGKNLSSVNFEDGTLIERIHARAFQSNNLEKVELPQNLKRIDLRAFIGNNELNMITIGAKVETIEQNAFGDRTDAFKEAYSEGGPGTYIWDGENWSKE